MEDRTVVCGSYGCRKTPQRIINAIAFYLRLVAVHCVQRFYLRMLRKDGFGKFHANFTKKLV